MNKKKIQATGYNDLGDPSSEIGTSQLPAFLILKSGADMLLKSHVGGEIDQLIVRLKGGSALVGKVGVLTLEDVEKLAIGHSPKRELIPKNHGIDMIFITGKPIVHPKRIDRKTSTNYPRQSSLTYIGSANQKKIFGLMRSGKVPLYDLI